jgi:DNA-binding beta-propeller fold protein YncE
MHTGKRGGEVRAIAAILLMALPATGAAQTIIPVKGTRLDADLFGNLYVIDGERCTLSLLDTGFVVRTEVGGPGWRPGEFDRPEGIWARNGLDLYVADYGNHRIQRFDRTLAFVSSLSGRDDASFGYPMDVALSRLGELFVVDGENQRIVKMGTSVPERVFGGFDAGVGKLHAPSRIAIGPSDRVYVLDGARVMVYDVFGNFLVSLYEGMWKAPGALYGDAERLIVGDSGTLYWFGPENQLLGEQALSGEVEAIGEVRAIAHHGRKLFLLGAGGLAVLADPRAGAGRD